jgi:hypothetical protein
MKKSVAFVWLNIVMKTVNSWVTGLSAKKGKVWYHMDCAEAGDRKKFLRGNRTFRVLILFSHQFKKQKEFQSILIHPAKHFEV